MNHRFYSICWVLIICLQSACNPKPTEEKVQKVDSAITQNANDILNNSYTKAALSLCNETYGYAYTHANTGYFDLNIQKDGDCFVFYSEITCGAPGGTCGLHIQIIKQIKNGYECVFETCGFHVTTSVETNYGYLSFTYIDRDGFRKKVNYNGKKFIETTTSINGLDYDTIKKMSENMGTDIRTFWPNDYEGTAINRNLVDIDDLQIGRKLYAKLYTVEGLHLHYFIFENDSIIFYATDILSLETVKNKTESHYALKTYSMRDYVMTQDSSYLLPQFYHYSARNKMYMPSKIQFGRVNKSY